MAAESEAERSVWKVTTSSSGQWEAAAVATVPPAPEAPSKPGGRRISWWIGGVGAVALAACCILGGVYGLTMMPGIFARPTATATASPEPIQTQLATETASIVAPVDTLQPTSIATHAPTPTATYPPLYARINSITIDSAGRYVVVYETFGFTEHLPGQHIHFFFDTVSPEQAGVPGGGPWVLYGGPRPFTGYRVNERPPGANQMCALVANSDHSVIPETGNCMDLPLPP
jgi:hypothetical protein